MAATAQSALAKLTSGQTLTNEERALLGMSPAPAKTTTSVSATARLDAAAAANKANAAATIAALQELGVGGATTKPLTATEKAAKQTADAQAAATKPTLTATQQAEGYTVQWVRTGVAGAGEWRIIRPASVTYGLNKPNTSSTGNTGNNTGNTGTGNTGTGTTTITTTTTTGGLTSAQMDVRSALDEFRSVLNSVGLGELATQMDTWIKENRQPAEIKTLVRTSQSYANRFPGMAELSKKNMAISEGAYIDLERGYTEILNAYGVDTGVFGSRSALGKYIANQVSAREFEERVNDAAVRVEQQPDVLAALSLYHGVDKSTAIAYLLDPKLGMDVVRKQVRAAEIGAAAMSAGFKQFGQERADIGSDLAESYVSQIGTEDLQTLKKEFGQAAILAQTQARLASIEGQAYSTDQAIQAAVVGNQQAGLESQRRAAREAARFGGQGSFITRQSTVGSI